MEKGQELISISLSQGYRSFKRYKARCNFLFSGISLTNKRMLEIGCGKGAFCLWAALHGAEYVLGIEPEADGSTHGSSSVFVDSIQKYNLENVEFKPIYLQQLTIPEKKYDIVMLYNVINHLDEDAVQTLDKEQHAYDKYKDIIHGLSEYMDKGSFLILSDCGRTNMWNLFGLKSPFASAIDWHKHQDPKQWIQLFNDAGFCLYDFRWTYLYPLDKLSSNWLVHFITQSHFTLRFKKT